MKLELTGQRYGRLTVVGRKERGPDGRSLWVCDCDCGMQAAISSASLRTGNTRSCGCLQRETRLAHGRSTDMSKLRAAIPKRTIATVAGLAVAFTGLIDSEWDELAI